MKIRYWVKTARLIGDTGGYKYSIIHLLYNDYNYKHLLLLL